MHVCKVERSLKTLFFVSGCACARVLYVVLSTVKMLFCVVVGCLLVS